MDNPGIHIRHLNGTDTQVLYESFAKAFADYEVQVTEAEFSRMCLRRGMDPSCSVGAFADQRLVSFIFNGIGNFGRKLTAYDVATGTLPDFRGQKLAGRLFETSLNVLRGAGVKQYLLEVLEHNYTAVKIYKNQGFTIRRELDYFVKEASQVCVPDKLLPPGFSLTRVQEPDPEFCDACSDFEPSWQNSHLSIGRCRSGFIYYLICRGDQRVAYSIFDPETGDVAGLGVLSSFRRMGLASVLMREMLKDNRFRNLKAVNSESSNEGFRAFMQACNMPLSGKQYEMILSLE